MVAMIASLVSYIRDLTAAEKAMIDAADEPSYKQGAKDDAGFYNPSPIDIFIVQEMLMAHTKLPPDVMDLVLDLAEYWVCSSSNLDFTQGRNVASGSGSHENVLMLRTLPIGLVNDHGGQFNTCSWNSEEEVEEYNDSEVWHGKAPEPVPYKSPVSREAYAKLANYPLPRLVNPVRKVVFKIRSHDQGWSGENGENLGPYDASWTWFEAGLEVLEKDDAAGDTAEPGQDFKLNDAALRSVSPTLTEGETPTFNFPLAPAPGWLIQKNKRADPKSRSHEIVWSYNDYTDEDSEAAVHLKAAGRGGATKNGEFIRHLAVGDIVTLWAKARFPGWSNIVEKASVSVYWAI